MFKICLTVMFLTSVSSFIVPQLFDYYEEADDTYQTPHPSISLFRKRSGNSIHLCGENLPKSLKSICVSLGGIRDFENGTGETFVKRCCRPGGCPVEELKIRFCKNA